jgi:hypothetical protein
VRGCRDIGDDLLRPAAGREPAGAGAGLSARDRQSGTARYHW